MENKTNYTNEGFIVKNSDGEDEIIHIPYNLNNVLVNETDIIQILAQYNVKIDKKICNVISLELNNLIMIPINKKNNGG